jgi:tetratricopeptide (TPR) repeat protein
MMSIGLVLILSAAGQEGGDPVAEARKLMAGEVPSPAALWKAVLRLKDAKHPEAPEIEAELWARAEVWPLAGEAILERRKSKAEFVLPGQRVEPGNYERLDRGTIGDLTSTVLFGRRKDAPAAPQEPVYFVVSTSASEWPVVYAARPSGLWVNDDLRSWIQVYRSEGKWGRVGASNFANRFEKIRRDWKDIRLRLESRRSAGVLDGVGPILEELAALIDEEELFDPLWETYVREAFRFLTGDAPDPDRSKTVLRALSLKGSRLQAAANPPENRLLAAVSLHVRQFPTCFRALQSLKEDAEAEGLRRKFAAEFDGGLVAGKTRQDAKDYTVYRLARPAAADRSAQAFVEVASYQGGSVLAILVRDGTDYRLDLQFQDLRVPLERFGPAAPDDEKLLAATQEAVRLGSTWTIWDAPACVWPSADFFREFERSFQALKLESSGDLAAARRVYDSILASKPRFEGARARRIALARRTGDWKSVKEDARVLVDLRPEHPWAWEALADADDALKEPPSLEYLNRLIALRKDSYSSYQARASFRRYRLGDLKGALADLAKAAEKGGSEEWITEERVQVRRALGQTSEAVEEFTTALNKRPSWKLFFARGALRRKLGDVAGADEDYARGCAQDPGDSTWSWIDRAGERAKKGDFKGAVEDYAQASRRTRESASLASYAASRAVYLEKLGSLDAAAEALEEAALREPVYARFAAAADLWRRAGNNRNADDCDKRALEAPVKGSPSSGHAERAERRWQRTDVAGALEDAGRAIESAANDDERAERYLARARFKHDLGDWPGALADADLSLKAARSWKGHHLRADLLQDLGRAVEVEEELRKAGTLKVPPLDAPARARERAKRGDFEGAIADMTDSLPHHWSQVLALRDRGEHALAAGKFDEAVRDLRASGDYGTPALAWALEAAGRNDEAVEVRKRLLDPSAPSRGYWEHLSLRARIGEMVKDGDDARAVAVLEADPDASDHLDLELELRRMRGDYAGALKALQDGPVTPWNLYRRSEIRSLAGDRQAADADLAAAAKIDLGRDPSAFRDRAEERLAIGDARGAAQDLARALTFSPAGQRRSLLSTQADALARAGDHAAAEALCDEVLALKKTAEAHLERAAIRRRAGNGAGAAADLEAALAMPFCRDELPKRARLRMNAGDRSGAEEDLSRYLESRKDHPSSTEVWIERAFLRLERGNNQGAEADMTQAVLLALRAGRDEHARAVVLQTVLLHRLGRTDEPAAGRLSRLPKTPERIVVQGVLTRNRPLIEEALRWRPRDSWVIRRAAEGLLAMGDSAASEALARRATEIDPFGDQGWLPK